MSSDPKKPVRGIPISELFPHPGTAEIIDGIPSHKPGFATWEDIYRTDCPRGKKSSCNMHNPEFLTGSPDFVVSYMRGCSSCNYHRSGDLDNDATLNLIGLLGLKAFQRTRE